MVVELYRRFWMWLFPKPADQPYRADGVDRSSMANLVRLFQDNDPPGPLRH